MLMTMVTLEPPERRRILESDIGTKLLNDGSSQSEKRQGMRKVIPIADVNNAKDPEQQFCRPGSLLSEKLFAIQ